MNNTPLDALKQARDALEDIVDTGYAGGPQGKRARAAIAAANAVLSHAALSAQSVSEGTEREFPPLPEPAITSYQIDSTMCKTEIRTYSTKQMREYALADRSAQAVSDGKKVPMTREEVELFAAQLVKQGSLTWAGFRQDEHGQYTIPVVNPSEYDLICALLAQGAAPSQEAVRERPADEQTKRIQELEAQLDTMERLKDLSQEALQEMRAKLADRAALSVQAVSDGVIIDVVERHLGRIPPGDGVPTAMCEELRSLLRPAAQEGNWEPMGEFAQKWVPSAAQEAEKPQMNELIDWLETEVSAISYRYHGEPSYDHDAYYMREQVMKVLANARKAFALEAADRIESLESALSQQAAQEPQPVAWRYRKPICNKDGSLAGYGPWILSERKDFLEHWPHEALCVVAPAKPAEQEKAAHDWCKCGDDRRLAAMHGTNCCYLLAEAEQQAPSIIEQASAGEAVDVQESLHEEIALREKFALLLAGVAVGLKGEELPLHRHSYHDLPEVAAVLRLERDLLKAQVEELQATLSTLPAVPKERFDALLKTEHALSASYVRIREIVGAMRPPSLEPEALYAYVEGKVRAALSTPPAVSSGHVPVFTRIVDCLEILNKRPRPMCRDCADEDGTCPNSGLDCDMRKLINTARKLLSAAPTAPQGEKS